MRSSAFRQWKIAGSAPTGDILFCFISDILQNRSKRSVLPKSVNSSYFSHPPRSNQSRRPSYPVFPLLHLFRLLFADCVLLSEMDSFVDALLLQVHSLDEYLHENYGIVADYLPERLVTTLVSFFPPFPC